MNNIDKLEIGKIYTYDELCTIFGEEKKTSNSRDSQKKVWACFFQWSNPTKQKYLIEEIFETPKAKIDGRRNNGGNNTSQYTALDDLLVEYFENTHHEKCTIPQLAVKIGILSDEYELCRKNKTSYCSENHFSIDLLEELLCNIQSCVLSALKSSLNRLSKGSYLSVSSYTVLALTNGSKKVLSSEDSQIVSQFDNSVLNEMGISKQDSFKECYAKKYQQKMNVKLSDYFACKTAYYYTQYEILRNDKIYSAKSNETLHRLSRKFVITIGIAMLRYICRYERKLNDAGYDQTDSIREIINLIEQFFVFILPDSWNEFWNKEEFNDENKELLFWSQYCLVKAHDNSETKTQDQCVPEQKKDYRKIALETLSMAEIQEIERILPDIDWTSIYEDENYNKRCGRAFEAYFDTKDTFKYCFDEPYVEEYCLYVAHIYMQGTEDQQIPFYEFTKQLC